MKPASHRPNRSARTFALVALVLVAAIGWFLGRRGEGATARALVDAGRLPTSGSAGDVPEVRAPDDREPTPSTSLHVWVRDLHKSHFTWGVPRVPFGTVWPAEGEGWDLTAFEGLQTPAAIRALSDHGSPFRSGPAARAATIAREEGFLVTDPDLSTPEATLVAMYGAWIEAEVLLEEDWRTYQATHLPEGTTWPDLTNEERRRFTEAHPTPAQDLGALQDIASAALARWPDHPIADHALLASVRAAMPYGFHASDGWDGELIAELIAEIGSPRLQEQAALDVTRFSVWTPAPPELLDVVAGVPTSSPQDDLRLSTWSLNRAVAAGDWDRARAWSDRLRAILDDACAVAEPHHSLQCERRQYELRDASSRLIALGYLPPTTWQEAMTAAAWRCHLASRHRGLSRTEATWTGERWDFGPWSQDTGATVCLADIGVTEVVPDGALRVALAFEGPPAP